MKKILNYIKNNITYVIFIAIVLILITYINHQSTKINELSNDVESSGLLIDALNDTIIQQKNSIGELTSSKRTIQTNFNELQKSYDYLNESQKKLVDRIDNLKNENNLISAAYIKIKAELDSLLITDGDGGVIINNDSSVTFTHKSDSLEFIGTVNNVIIGSKSPSFLINNLMIPNEQFISFEWENDDDYYQKPVRFSITNTNPLITTTGIESYSIPEVNKNLIKPTNWQKFKKFVTDEKNSIVVYAIFLGGGFLLGAGL